MSTHNGMISRDTPFPTEVLYEIFSNLPISILVVVACASQKFNAVAEHILYSSIYIKDTLSQSSPSPWRTKVCCESILKRVHLVGNIRGFHVRWMAEVQTPHRYSSHPPSLESLELRLGPANPANTAKDTSTPHVVERIISGCHFPQLVTCSFGADWSKGSPAYSDTLNKFLRSLPLLRHLKLPDHHTPLNIPLRAPCSVLLLWPIQYLAMAGDDYDMNQAIVLARLASTTLPLRSLDLSAMSVRPILLRNIATHLPTIETLKLRLALRHTLHYALSGIVSGPISPFYLSPTIVAGAPGSDMDQELGLCKEWSKSCPSLKKITFPSQAEWVIDSDGLWLATD
ncbi:hypothetical protein BDP27DRAFT_1310446 [Rhodocollybia butyracea]|uniref:F-box domain-containing protein n=1 Tax=Rhodocollybia butyracea TaxID=206335 RepID=A0A9P5Q4G7_9AGAR|nr:hypothetical protein BDP27DRAFT_1310446 [Rhodocollybia butyracea]